MKQIENKEINEDYVEPLSKDSEEMAWAIAEIESRVQELEEHKERSRER